MARLLFKARVTRRGAPSRCGNLAGSLRCGSRRRRGQGRRQQRCQAQLVCTWSLLARPSSYGVHSTSSSIQRAKRSLVRLGQEGCSVVTKCYQNRTVRGVRSVALQASKCSRRGWLCMEEHIRRTKMYLLPDLSERLHAVAKVGWSRSGRTTIRVMCVQVTARSACKLPRASGSIQVAGRRT